MKYDARELFVKELDLDSEPLSIEEMGRYLEEYATEDDWDEDFLNEDWDDFDKIDRKVEEFSVRIAELEEELKQVRKQTQFLLSDSGGLSSRQEILEYKIYVLDEQKSLLIGHKEILEGKGIPSDEVFADARKLILGL
jgi:predicted transcriptional regulator